MWWSSQICNDSDESRQGHFSGNSRLRQNDKEEQETVSSKNFLDLIKSVWLLLSGLAQAVDFDRLNAVVKEGVTILAGRVLKHIDLMYAEFSGIPDYKIINDHGDFRIAMFGRRSSTIDSDGLSLYPNRPHGGTHNRERGFQPDSRHSRPPPQISPIHIGHGRHPGPSAHFGLSDQITDSAVSQNFMTGVSEGSKDHLPHSKSLSSNRRSTADWPILLHTAARTRYPDPTQELERTRYDQIMNEDQSQLGGGFPTTNSRQGFALSQSTAWASMSPMHNYSSSSAQGPVIASAVFDRQNRIPESKKSMTCSQQGHHIEHGPPRIVSHPYTPHPENVMDGLHVSKLEQSVLAKSVDDIQAERDEIELVNSELIEDQEWSSRLAGFYKGVSCTEEAEAHHAIYQPARVRIFKNKLNGQFHLWTGREASSPDEHIVHPLTEFVPIYAFADDRSKGLEKSGVAEVYLRHQGMQCSLRYRFKSPNPGVTRFPYELLGFQGALLGLQFEEEYKVSMVEFLRKGKSKPETESDPRLQIWTEVSEGKDHSSRESRSLSSFAQKTFTVNFDDALCRIDASKIFVYSSDDIYILLVSDRIKIEPSSYSRGDKKRLRIVPNKRSGSSTVRLRKIRGFHDRKAGIPLNQSGMRYADQLGSGFDDFASVGIDFYSENHASEFIDGFGKQLAAWRERFAPVEEFRELQRNRTITVSSSITIDPE